MFSNEKEQILKFKSASLFRSLQQKLRQPDPKFNVNALEARLSSTVLQLILFLGNKFVRTAEAREVTTRGVVGVAPLTYYY